MPSQFPGMDPFIESQVWEDFHSSFLTVLREVLVARLRPKYVVQVEKRIYLERELEEERTSYVADAAIYQGSNSRPGQPSATDTAECEQVGVHIQTATVPMLDEHRESFLTLRRNGDHEVVTVIELLSPTNKRPKSEGNRLYLEKRISLMQSQASFVEIDLLIGGDRMPFRPNAAEDYLVLISRANRRPLVTVISREANRQLPRIPIPLAVPDEDVVIDLQMVFNEVYDRAGYDYAIDYSQTL
jgi:hypothetical protein